MTPEHLHEVEVKLLGTYKATPDLFDGIEHLISENIFIRPVCRMSYKIIKECHTSGIMPDNIILFQKLKAVGFQQADIAMMAGATEEFEYKLQTEQYVKMLFNNSVAKYIMPILQEAHSKLHQNSIDAVDVIGKVSEAINNVNLVANNVSKTKSIHQIYDEAVQRIRDAANKEVEYMGYSWGLTELDKKTGGIIQGTNTIAAMPGAGKSTLVINIIRANAIDKNVPMLVFSIEMPAVEMMTNIIANITEINSRTLREGTQDAGHWMSIDSVKQRLKDNLEIDDTGGITWQYFEAKVKAFRKKHRIPPDKTILVAKDYLQLMGSAPEERKLGREERMELICNEQTRICKNENIALVDLSQFSREASRRDIKDIRPRMTDLKGSGAIEANSVLILLMFRPEYHGITQDDKGNDLRGLVEINIAKGRYVNPEPIYAKFIGKYSKFADYTPEINSGLPAF